MTDNRFDHSRATTYVSISTETRNKNAGFMIGSQPLIGSPLESDESLFLMYEREKWHLPRNDYLNRLRTGVLDLAIRREALNWILQAHSYYSFGPLSFCLSVNYLDRFLSVFELPRGKSWAVQLLAVTCLSIAIKIEETSLILTVDLQVCGPKFVFEGKTIQRMELLVLSTLNWKMQACTPFSFIDYFLRKITGVIHLSSMSLVSRTIQLILNTIKDLPIIAVLARHNKKKFDAWMLRIDFLDFRPSEIAAAVAISVSTVAIPDIAKVVSSFNYLEKDRVLKCLQLIKDLKLMGDPDNYTVGGAHLFILPKP